MHGSVPYHITDIAEPVKVKDQYCTVLTVPDIEEAERICLKWDHIIVNDKQQRLKAHIHPYSYRRRPTDKVSIHPLFKDRFDPKTVKKEEPALFKTESNPGAPH